MNNKDLSVMEKYLHPEVRLISPLADITGKSAVLNSFGKALFCYLQQVYSFSNGDQAM